MKKHLVRSILFSLLAAFLVLSLVFVYLPQPVNAWDSYTKLMLHFNGTDESITFTDEIGHTFTANGSAQLDTVQKKFGTASGMFNGFIDWIDTPDHADFTVGSGEFTIDFWVKRARSDIWEIMCGQCDDIFLDESFVGAVFNEDNTIYFEITDGVDWYPVTSVGTIIDLNWHHIAVVRDNTGTDTLRLFIDGVADGTGACDGCTVTNSTHKLTIGRAGEVEGTNFNGWIDEFRLSVGTARWTSGFTPPTSEYSSEPSISNIPDYWTIGAVQENASYWAKGSAPTFPIDNSECSFSVTNDSSVAIDISIKAANFTGGNGWTLTSGSPGSGTVRLLAFKSGDAITDNVTLTTSDQPFIINLADNTTMMWELLLQTGVFTDGVAKSDNITLTSTVH